MFLHLSVSHSVHRVGVYQTLPGQTATAADGTHPTGMLSCWLLLLPAPGGGGGDFPAYITGHMTKGVHPRGGLHPGGLHPGWVGQPPPHSRDTWDTTGYGQQAGGTHPTRMYSCWSFC